MCNNPSQDCSIVASTILQQSLAQFFNSNWHECSTVTGTIIQQWLVRFFNSHWHNSSTVTGTILQQWLARFFNSHWHDSSTVTGKIFSFFYAGRILQQWCSLLKNRTMYQEYDTWSHATYKCYQRYREKLLLYWIQYKNSLKYKVGCFWRFSFVYTIN